MSRDLLVANLRALSRGKLSPLAGAVGPSPGSTGQHSNLNLHTDAVV